MRHETILLGDESMEIDYASNTIQYDIVSNQRLILDQILAKPHNLDPVANDISQELIQGFNSSVLCLESVPIMRRVVEMVTSEKILEMKIKVYEVYGDSLRDLVDSSSIPKLGDSHEGLIVEALSATPIESLSDFDNVLHRVNRNCGNDPKAWVIHEIQFLQNVDDNLLNSRLRIINTCSIEYSGMDRSKLVLTEGLLMAESMKEFYEIVLNPSLMACTKSTIPLLLEAELGGNSSVRWIAKVPEIIDDEESERILWLFNVLHHARQMNNIPVTNTQFVVENQKRLWSRMSKRASAVVSKPLAEEKNKQREKDLLQRINTLIQDAAENTTTMQQYKQEALKERKTCLEAKIQISKLNDEIVVLEGKIFSLHEKEKAMMFKVSEKVILLLRLEIGIDKNLAVINEKLVSKIKELEFHIIQLLSAKDNAQSTKGRLENEIEMLKRHNSCLRDLSVLNSSDSEEKIEVEANHQNLVQNKTIPSNPSIEELQQTIQEYRHKIHGLVKFQKISPNSVSFHSDLIQSYVDNERHLIDQIQSLKSSTGQSQSIELRRELALFMNETQMRLEREKYSLLAKCSALEEEMLVFVVENTAQMALHSSRLWQDYILPIAQQSRQQDEKLVLIEYATGLASCREAYELLKMSNGRGNCNDIHKALKLAVKIMSTTTQRKCCIIISCSRPIGLMPGVKPLQEANAKISVVLPYRIPEYEAIATSGVSLFLMQSGEFAAQDGDYVVLEGISIVKSPKRPRESVSFVSTSKKIKASPTIPKDSPTSQSGQSQKKALTPGSDHSSPPQASSLSPTFQNFANGLLPNNSPMALNHTSQMGSTAFLSPAVTMQGNTGLNQTQHFNQQPNSQYSNIQQQQQKLLQQQQHMQLQQQIQQQQNNMFNQTAQIRNQNLSRSESPIINGNNPNAIAQSQSMMGRNSQQQNMMQDTMQQNFQSFINQPTQFQAFNNSQQILQSQKQQFEQHLERNNMALSGGTGMAQGGMQQQNLGIQQNIGMQQNTLGMPLRFNNAPVMMQKRTVFGGQTVAQNASVWSGNLTWTANLNTPQQMDVVCGVTAHSVRQTSVNDISVNLWPANISLNQLKIIFTPQAVEMFASKDLIPMVEFQPNPQHISHYSGLVQQLSSKQMCVVIPFNNTQGIIIVQRNQKLVGFLFIGNAPIDQAVKKIQELSNLNPGMTQGIHSQVQLQQQQMARNGGVAGQFVRNSNLTPQQIMQLQQINSQRQ